MSFFSNLFNKQSESVLGIDIGSSSIKVVQLKKKGGKAYLDTYGELALGPYSDPALEIGRATNLSYDKVSEALNDLLKEAHTTSTLAGVAIPFGASLVSVIEMPAVPQRQLETMIPIEARKYIPVPIAEVMLDWWVIPKADEGPIDPDEEAQVPQKKEGFKKIDVLVVAIHNDTITKFQQIVNKTRLNTSFFEIELFGSMRSVLDQEVQPVMIFDMGAALTKLYIVERGVMRSSHNINRGSQDITIALSKSLGIPMAEAEIVKRSYGTSPENMDKNVGDIIALSLEYIFSEANRIILSHERRYKKNISRAILVGGGVKLANFSEFAKKGLQTEVVMGDPFSKTETPAFLENVLRTTGPEFAVAVGVALRRLHELP